MAYVARHGFGARCIRRGRIDLQQFLAILRLLAAFGLAWLFTRLRLRWEVTLVVGVALILLLQGRPASDAFTEVRQRAEGTASSEGRTNSDQASLHLNPCRRLACVDSNDRTNRRRRLLKIAMLGSRGVPASYSGFETYFEELGARLVERGHEVTVYCRAHHITYDQPTYRGMRLVKIPTIANKYLDTIVHSFLSSLHALTQGYDLALYVIAGNSLVTWIPRLAGQVTVLNVDGLDWKRAKWPGPAKAYIRFAERMAIRLPTAYLTDSRVVQTYYRDTYHSEPPYIPYGSEVPRVPPGDTLAKFGLEPRKYILFVGRLVPENCAHHLVEAFQGLDTDLKCVIVGDAPYAEKYIAQLKATDDRRVVFTGYQFGAAYHELGSNAAVFVETSGVGGTHPALLEAMSFGNCVIVHDTAENLETIEDAGLSYHGAAGAGPLRDVLARLLADPDLVADFRVRAAARAAAVYSWDAITDQYGTLFEDLLRRKPKNLEGHRPSSRR